jgi:recombination protein RecT
MPTDQTAASAREVVASAAAAPAKRGPTLRDMLEAQKTEIARALPMSLDASRYVRIVQTELRKSPKLMNCEPRSFLGAVITAAQLGLEFGPLGQAYLVPFKNKGVDEVQLIIGYKGWLALAHRSGAIASISARAVHKNDTFDYEFGLDEKLVHRPAEGDRGPVTHYYCVAKTKDGGVVFSVMSKHEVEVHRDRYAKKVNGQIVGPWASHFDEMALKTAFKKVFTWLPMTTDAALASASDNAVITRVSVDDEGEIEQDDDVIDAEVIDPETGEVTAYDRGE